MTATIHAEHIAGITELKRDPMALIHSGGGAPVAVLSRNKPVFYCVPTQGYEAIMDALEDLELAQIARERSAEPAIAVDLDALPG